MTAVIVGATGLLGGNLAAELVRAGHAVRATRRGSSRVDHLSELPIEWVSGDLSDVEAMARAFAGAEVVFHCAARVSIVRRVTPELHRDNVEGTANVIEACKRATVPRLVYTSTVAAVGLSEDGRPCDESATWNFDRHGLDDGYSTTKHQAEALVRAAAAELDAVVVNPTYLLGPYDVKPTSGRLIVAVVRGRVPGLTSGANNFVDVRDVARGMMLAWKKGERGERYILGGENLRFEEIFRRIAAVAGVKPLRWHVPRPLSRVLGWGGDLYEAATGREPLINSVSMDYGYCTTFQFSSERAKRELGYAPGPIEPAIADAIAWFRQAGML